MTDSQAQTENYLKAIFNAREWTEEPVTVTVLAARLGLAPSSVSEAVRKLAERGLVSHAPYAPIALTTEGQRVALGMARKHRLIETFLVERLGYSWDEVHDEAEVLEHAVSDRFVDALAAHLGDPKRDPHGDPIPRADGSLPGPALVPLAEVEPGRPCRVARVSDADPDLLRFLERSGVVLDAAVTLMRVEAAAGTVELELAGSPLSLGVRAASAIRVIPE